MGLFDADVRGGMERLEYALGWIEAGQELSLLLEPQVSTASQYTDVEFVGMEVTSSYQMWWIPSREIVSQHDYAAA